MVKNQISPISTKAAPAISSMPDDDEDDFHDNPSSHASDLMTASYSEISFQGLNINSSPAARPASLAYETASSGTLLINSEIQRRTTNAAPTGLRGDGPMTSFVADDLIDQIKLASPVQRLGTDGCLVDDATTPHVPRQFLQQSQVRIGHQYICTKFPKMVNI